MSAAGEWFATGSSLAPGAAFGRRFAADEAGGAAVFFALVLSFVLLAAAITIDYGTASVEKLRQQSALDAASLAASEKLGAADQDTAGPAVANAFYAANTRSDTRGTLDQIVMNSEASEVRLGGIGQVATSLMNVLGVNRLEIGTSSRILRGSGSVEIALVLDNSGSMSSELTNLKTAALDLTNAVFSGAATSQRVYFGLVPFASSVNIGSANAGQSWIDGASVAAGSRSPLHFQNFAEQVSRWELFTRTGVAWKGCVEARPAPYNVTDALPVTGTPSTLFVPMFAPDEPDNENASAAGYDNYPNNYMSDFGGSCPAAAQTCTNYNKRKNRCEQWANTPIDVATAQSRTCKYTTVSPSNGKGPNYQCTTQPVLPLTSTRAQIDTAINGMTASGNTNISEGVMWGWRVLSPDPPFTEGKPYNAGGNKKYLIVMTDGENNYSGQSNHNKSIYASYGYGAKNRLGTTYTTSGYNLDLNEKTRTACANAKAAGLLIYTVAFRLDTDPSTRALLAECASTTDKAYTASSGAGLLEAFKDIGRNINQVRIAG